MTFLKKLPLPLAGTALGFAALGNLLKDEPWRSILGAIAIVFFLLVLVKLLVYPKQSREALNNPVVASSFATFPMAIMILSTYLPKGSLAKTLWFIGIALHILLLLWFSYRFLFKDFAWGKIFPSWFVVYVGLGAATVSAPAHGQQALGMFLFWFSLGAYALTLVLVVLRLFKVKEIPEPAKPTLVIMAAPPSLLLAGYMSSAAQKLPGLVVLLLCFCLFFYLVGLIGLVRSLPLPFYPSYSSFTFPLVISAMALKLTAGYYAKMGTPNQQLVTISQVAMAVAVIFCFYTLARFIMHLAKAEA